MLCNVKCIKHHTRHASCMQECPTKIKALQLPRGQDLNAACLSHGRGCVVDDQSKPQAPLNLIPEQDPVRM